MLPRWREAPIKLESFVRRGLLARETVEQALLLHAGYPAEPVDVLQGTDVLIVAPWDEEAP